MRLFIYGTLLNHPTLSHALRYLPRTRKAKLQGVAVVNRDGYPTLKQSIDGVVPGEVFEASEAELDKLDKWEEKYSRIAVQLQDGSTADTYVLKKK